MKGWSGEEPDKDDKTGSGKCPGTSEDDRGAARKNANRIAHEAEEVPFILHCLEFFSLFFHRYVIVISQVTWKMGAQDRRFSGGIGAASRD